MSERAYYLSPIQFFNLSHAVRALKLNGIEGCLGIYLVGSVSERRDWRDVDVRMIMNDDIFEKLFPDAGQDTSASGGAADAMWSAFCVSVSAYLSQQSGLPVDFQVQPQGPANEKHKKPRNALGHPLYYPGGDWKPAVAVSDRGSERT